MHCSVDPLHCPVALIGSPALDWAEETKTSEMFRDNVKSYAKTMLKSKPFYRSSINRIRLYKFANLSPGICISLSFLWFRNIAMPFTRYGRFEEEEIFFFFKKWLKPFVRLVPVGRIVS